MRDLAGVGEALSVPTLSNEEALRLWLDAKSQDFTGSAWEHLIHSYLRLASTIARKSIRAQTAAGFEAIESAAFEYLCGAVRRFRPGHGVDLKTWVALTVRRGILNEYNRSREFEREKGIEIELDSDRGCLETEEKIQALESKVDVHLLMKDRISDRECSILLWHFGLGGEHEHTRKEIGKKLGGMSRQWVRLLEKRALQKLREAIRPCS